MPRIAIAEMLEEAANASWVQLRHAEAQGDEAEASAPGEVRKTGDT